MKWVVAGGGSHPSGKAPFLGNGIVKVWEVSNWKPHYVCEEGFTDVVDSLFFLSKEEVAVSSKKLHFYPPI